MVTVSDVRKYLNDLSDEHVSDDAIQIQIRLAETVVDNEKSATATQQLIEDATLAIAGEFTYIAYSTELERGQGILPPIISTYIDYLKLISERMLNYVRRGVPTYPAPWVLSKSLWAEEVVNV